MDAKIYPQPKKDGYHKGCYQIQITDEYLGNAQGDHNTVEKTGNDQKDRPEVSKIKNYTEQDSQPGYDRNLLEVIRQGGNRFRPLLVTAGKTNRHILVEVTGIFLLNQFCGCP